MAPRLYYVSAIPQCNAIEYQSAARTVAAKQGVARLDKGHGLYVSERRQEHIGDPKFGGMQKIHEIHGLVEADGLLDSVALRHVRR